MQYDSELDTSGLRCPEPVMLLHSAVRDLDPGQMVKVTATDPSTKRDIPKFCSFLGHTLEYSGEEDDLFIFIIRKKAESD